MREWDARGDRMEGILALNRRDACPKEMAAAGQLPGIGSLRCYQTSG